jgi:hypothetical protein
MNMRTGKQGNLSRTSSRNKTLRRGNFPKIDVLVAIVGTSIGLEFLPHYLGIDLKGFTLAWIFLPPVLFVSLIQHLKEYLSANVLRWIAVFMLPMVGYAFFVNWDESIPLVYTVPYVLRSFSLSLVILSFFIVHGSKPEGRNTFMYTLIGAGVVAVVLNTVTIIGLSEFGMTQVHLGHQKYIVRISPLGDPNISVIYLIALAVSFSLWQKLIGERLGFIVGTLCFLLAIFTVAGTASRGGFIAIIVSGIVLYFSLWLKLKRYKLLTLSLLIIPLVIMIHLISTNRWFVLPQQFHPLSYRFSVIVYHGIDESLGHRLDTTLWFIKDIFSGPRLFGIGFEEFTRKAAPRGAALLPHNSFVDMYVIGGIISFLAYIALWLRAISSHKRCLNDHDEMMRLYGVWGLAFGVGISVLLLTLSFVFTKIIWAYLGVAVSLYKSTKPKNRYKIRW